VTLTLEAERFARVTALDRWASDAVLAAWAGLDLTDLQGSFVGDVLPAALTAVTTAQLEAADIGADYTDAVAEREGIGAGPRVNRAGFVGIASDGRSLGGLLSQPLVDLFKALAVGLQSGSAVAASRDSLDEIVTTQVHDAAREAEHVGLAANTDLAGYLRVVEPKACGRCVILAGRFYRWNDGFLRHPRCRCSNQPLERASEPQSPRELFDRMSPEDQVNAFGVDGARAVRDGADPARVVNARRGMSTTTNGRKARVNVFGREVFTTTEMAKGRKAPVRLMPQSIYEIAAGDRDEAIRLLRANQYIF
jgi:hypothetical protein